MVYTYTVVFFMNSMYIPGPLVIWMMYMYSIVDDVHVHV